MLWQTNLSHQAILKEGPAGIDKEQTLTHCQSALRETKKIRARVVAELIVRNALLEERQVSTEPNHVNEHVIWKSKVLTQAEKIKQKHTGDKGQSLACLGKKTGL